MRRRTVLSVVLGGGVMMAGCGEADDEIDTQPESVPVWVNNQAGERVDVSVEFRTAGSGDLLVSTTVAPQPGDEESVYAKPIREDGEYVLSITVGGESTERTIAGGGLRSIEVNVYAAGRVDISRVDT
ncbi:MAG: hypothetical protein ABEJ43_06945 [Haloferacaceae archaeon]